LISRGGTNQPAATAATAAAAAAASTTAAATATAATHEFIDIHIDDVDDAIGVDEQLQRGAGAAVHGRRLPVRTHL